MKKGLLVGYMECSVLQVRGVSQTREVVRDTHRSREARTGGAKWILLFTLSSAKLFLSPFPLPPPHLLSTLFSLLAPALPSLSLAPRAPPP